MLLMDANAHELEESSPKVVISQRIIVALNALSKVRLYLLSNTIFL